MNVDECELLISNDTAVSNATIGDRDIIECVVTLEPEITVVQCEGSDTFTSISACEPVCDINALQQQLTETKENRDLYSRILLPEGKEAHFFISYSSDDRFRVLPIVAQLERNNGVACILDERDFKAGMEIHENIRRSMEKSMKVLLFLSENFLQSGYCNHEKNLAFVMSMRTGRNIIIPVKLEDCEVPSTLETLTYIDVNTENLTDRIIEAYSSTETDFLPDDFGSTRKLENGYSIILPCETEQTFCLRPKRSKTTLSDETKQLLSIGKFQVPEERVQDAIDIINSYRLSGRWSCKAYCCLCCCTWPFVVLSQMVMWGIIGLAAYDHHFSQKAADMEANQNIAIWIVPPLGSIILFFGIVCYNWRRQKAARGSLRADILQHVTLKTYKDGVMFKVKEDTPDITIEIVRYDIKPCQMYLARKIKLLLEETCGNLYTFSKAEYEDRADLLIRNILYSYTYYSVPDAPENRHNVKGGRSCFCQFIEPNVGHHVQSWLNTLEI